MARTTRELMEGVLELDEDIDVTPFIDVANELVTEACGTAGYADKRLELIETWLACHFYSIRDQQSMSEQADRVSVRYEGQWGKGLDFTRYGQQAKMLDTKGGLARIDAAAKKAGTITPQIKWLGGWD